MPASDILNSEVNWQADIQDCMTPDFGFTRSRPSGQVSVRAAAGRPYNRTVTEQGHVFNFSWLNRSWLCAQRLKWYYEQYLNGFFTIIDWDGGGRYYVGRFTSEPEIKQTGNDRYDIASVTFEEIPGIAMEVYPGDWDNDAIDLFSIDDYGDSNVALSGTWSNATTGDQQILIANGVATVDTLAVEYVGYGFQLWSDQGPAYGQFDLSVDSVSQGVVDLYSSTQGTALVFTVGSLPIGFHLIKMTALGTRNSASSANAINFFKLRVMR